jgi:uncharacterized membrane protein
MNKHSSSQLLTATAKAEPESIVEISQDNQKKPQHKKDYTSNIIGWILQGGVMLSASIILIGLILLLIHLGEQPGLVMSIGTFPHSLRQVWSGLIELQPQAIIATGLLLLIVTPVITVTMSLVAFVVKRDLRFVVITCVVLAILLTSVLIGKGS